MVGRKETRKAVGSVDLTVALSAEKWAEARVVKMVASTVEHSVEWKAVQKAGPWAARRAALKAVHWDLT
jgi:hypothetical protein